MLSRSSEYAIRALTRLARHGDGAHHLARDLARELGLPAPFLGKVLQPLVARGILHSRRGRSGGFRLARPAAEIRLLDVVQIEETLAPAETCLLGQRECADESACPLHEYWKAAASAFRARLFETTLDDLARYAAAHPSCAYPLPGPLSTTPSSPPSAARAHALVRTAS